MDDEQVWGNSLLKNIRVYVEGGRKSRDANIWYRKALKTFLREIDELTDKKVLKVELCASRDDTFKDFKKALAKYPDSFNVLLVDSEGPVSTGICRWQHLKARDKWEPPGVSDDHCQFMAQAMEAWFVADIETLEIIYGKDFNRNPFPKRSDVEKIDKPTLNSSLKKATKCTQMGEYHKFKHAPKILERLDVSKVRVAAPHCDRLFKTLIGQINTS